MAPSKQAHSGLQWQGTKTPMMYLNEEKTLGESKLNQEDQFSAGLLQNTAASWQV